MENKRNEAINPKKRRLVDTQGLFQTTR
jgi:hypothetical protein